MTDTDREQTCMRSRILSQRSIKLTWLILLFLLSLTCVLSAGLWPFNFFPVNSAIWNESDNSLSFRKPSIAYIPVLPSNLDTQNGFTIELKIKPLHRYLRTFPRILSIGTISEELLAVGQWKSGIVFRAFDSCTGGYNEIGYRGAFSEKRPVHITLSTGPEGTVIFLDGKAVRKEKRPLLSSNSILNGTVVLANDLSGDHPWSGKFYYLSISSGHYTGRNLSDRKPGGDNLIRIDFTRRDESLTPSNITELIVPQRFSPPHRKVLTPFWVDFRLNRRYFADLILNILGFIPSGLLLGLIFLHSGLKPWKTLIFTFFILFSVSLCIELSQVTLPTRTSQLSDLILNTTGGLSGGLLSLWFDKRMNISEYK